MGGEGGGEDLTRGLLYRRKIIALHPQSLSKPHYAIDNPFCRLNRFPASVCSDGIELDASIREISNERKILEEKKRKFRRILGNTKQQEEITFRTLELDLII